MPGALWPLDLAAKLVLLVSLWANFISHWTAWLASRVEVRSKRLEDEFNERLAIQHIDSLAQRIELQQLAILSWLRDLSASVTDLIEKRDQG